MVTQLRESIKSLISRLTFFLNGSFSMAPPCLKFLAFPPYTLEIFSISSLWSSAFLLELVEIFQIPV